MCLCSVPVQQFLASSGLSDALGVLGEDGDKEQVMRALVLYHHQDTR